MSNQNKPAIEQIRVIGGFGLWFIGMPRPFMVGEIPAAPDLHSAEWEKGGVYDGEPYTYAALHAEMLVLQAFGLLASVTVLEIPIYDRTRLFWVHFRYTEEGAAIALRAWEKWRYRQEEDSEGQF